MLAGCIPGALLLKNADVSNIKVIFGNVAVLFGLEMLFRDKKRVEGNPLSQSSPRSRLTFGALLAVYVDRVTDSGSEFKANISAVFIADNTFRIILYSALHLLTFDTLKSALMLIPIAILGLFAGMKSSSLLKEKTVRRMMAVLLILSGVSLTLQNM